MGEKTIAFAIHSVDRSTQPTKTSRNENDSRLFKITTQEF